MNAGDPGPPPPAAAALWQARYVLLPAADGDRPPPDGSDPASARRQSQRIAAAHIEGLARSVLAGVQPTGEQTDPRRVLVDQAATAQMVAAIWQAAPPAPAEQAIIDQALGCLRQCFDQGVVILEWDRPGYEDVTAAFQELMIFATHPSATPLGLPWVEASPRSTPAEPAPTPRPRRWAAALTLGALLTVGLLLLLRLPTPSAPIPSPPQLQRLRDRLGAPDLAGLPDDPTARAAALARLDQGDPAGAAALLQGSPALGVQQLQVELFVYLHACP